MTAMPTKMRTPVRLGEPRGGWGEAGLGWGSWRVGFTRGPWGCGFFGDEEGVFFAEGGWGGV